MLPETISYTRWISLLMLMIIMLAVMKPMNGQIITYEPIDQTKYITNKTNKVKANQYNQSIAAATKRTTKRNSFIIEPFAAEQRQTVAQIASDPVDAAWIEYSKQYPFLEKDPTQFKAVEVVATGYTAGPESTGKEPSHPEYGITYSGIKVRKAKVSTIAADTSVFPLGTLLYIPGYGYGIVADTGSAIKGNKLDLFYQTKKQVYEQWGKKKVKVYVLDIGDGKVTEKDLDSLNEAFSLKENQPSAL